MKNLPILFYCFFNICLAQQNVTTIILLDMPKRMIPKLDYQKVDASQINANAIFAMFTYQPIPIILKELATNCTPSYS
jgi:Na+/H+ antiporter NhaC